MTSKQHLSVSKGIATNDHLTPESASENLREHPKADPSTAQSIPPHKRCRVGSNDACALLAGHPVEAHEAFSASRSLNARPVTPQPTRWVQRYRTILHNSIVASDWDTFVSRLRTHPGESAICDQNGDTPLQYAISVEAPHTIIHRLLEVDGGEMLGQYNDKGCLPIHNACRLQTSIQSLATLLEHWPGMALTQTIPSTPVTESRQTSGKLKRPIPRTGTDAIHVSRHCHQQIYRGNKSYLRTALSPSSLPSSSTHFSNVPFLGFSTPCTASTCSPPCKYFATSISGPDLHHSDHLNYKQYTAFDWVWSKHDARDLFIQDEDRYSSHAAANSVRDLWSRLSLLLLAAYRHIIDQSEAEQCSLSTPCPASAGPPCSLPLPPHWTLSPGDRAHRCTFRVLHASISVPTVPVEVIKFVLRTFPDEVRARDQSGNLPLHLVAQGICAPRRRGWILSSEEDTDRRSGGKMMLPLILKAYPKAARSADNRGRLPLHLALQSGHWFHSPSGGSCSAQQKGTSSASAGPVDTGISDLLNAYPEALLCADPVTKLYPAMIAATACRDSHDVAGIGTVFELLLKDCSVVKIHG